MRGAINHQNQGIGWENQPICVPVELWGLFNPTKRAYCPLFWLHKLPHLPVYSTNSLTSHTNSTASALVLALGLLRLQLLASTFGPHLALLAVVAVLLHRYPGPLLGLV